ncbi:regulatory LuxR family protein [Streptomyces sp. TLI_235]|nr:LuxR family transcriptional regulator [Streptomyces sp. TLI_235]PBC75387.1 regulatory LuxR family protein [Streptomyces sp. TLI_235]
MRISSPTTVGRHAELDLARQLLTDARKGAGRGLVLLGEAGIGKSRLVAECAALAGALGVPVLRGRAGATGLTAPFRPLIEALSSLSRGAGLPTGPELAPYRPALARLVPEWRDPGGPGYPESVVELAEAVLRLLAVLGRGTGCAVLLEDLHAADSETLAVLDYLVDNLADLPVLLVVTLRPETGPALDLARSAARRRVASVVALGPLEAADVRAIAAGCLETTPAGVPDDLAARLYGGGEGNPYLVEELLADLVRSGALLRGPDGWQLVGEPAASVPDAVVQAYGHRLAVLDPPVRGLLQAAAALGTRFSLTTLRTATGSAEPELFAGLRAATEAGFVRPDGTRHDQYAFRHALTGEAVLATLPPAERAALARSAAAALEAADPGLGDDEQCRLVARLLAAAGDPAAAALRYAEAGRRARESGASASAVALLEHAHRLAAPPDRTGVAESLALALAEAGQLDRALAVADSPDLALPSALGTDRRIALHTRLAWEAVMAERRADSLAQLAAARALLTDPAPAAGPSAAATPPADQRAALAVVEGHLTLLPGPDGQLPPPEQAERLAREAAETAERAPLPVVACQAWQLLALLGRERGFDHADACLERMLAVAEQHALPVWRVEALVRLGVNAFMRTGSSRRLEQARDIAGGLGALLQTQTTDGLLAMQAVLRGDHAAATAIVDRSLDASARLRNLATHRYLLLTAATLAAHRGRRRDMERELQRFDRAGGEEASFLTPVLFGLCRAVCALLEEDRAGAEAELAAAAAWEDDHPSVFYLSGRYGLRPLLDTVAGRADRARLAACATAPAAELAWNRQFLRLADAVLLGREGHADRAARTVDEVRRDAADLFPTGYHLGLRLAAEAALADGWGDPTTWLRTAEEYFHGLDVPAVAGACRGLLRRAGAGVAQRRTGRDQVPADLRVLGVTLREFEVLVLLAERPGNQEIARRLSISPRTVEKHVAGLIRKTGRPGRDGLRDLALALAVAS